MMDRSPHIIIYYYSYTSHLLVHNFMHVDHNILSVKSLASYIVHCTVSYKHNYADTFLQIMRTIFLTVSKVNISI